MSGKSELIYLCAAINPVVSVAKKPSHPQRPNTISVSCSISAGPTEFSSVFANSSTVKPIDVEKCRAQTPALSNSSLVK